MKKIFFAALLAGTSIYANGGVFDVLKKAPASQYELGKLKLEIGAQNLTELRKGKRMGDSNFKVEKFHVEEDDGKLSFVGTFKGRAREMNDNICQAILESFKGQSGFDKFTKSVWPGLGPEQYIELQDEFFFVVELVSSENESFTIRC